MNNPYQAPMMNNPYIQSQNPYMDRMNFLQNYQQSLQQPLVPTQMSGATQQAIRDMDKRQGKMYYSEPIAPHVSESNYDRAKRHYTETKEMHKGASTEDKEHKMKALDMYIRELSGDISELLNDMTPDERNLLRTKMSNLASKL